LTPELIGVVEGGLIGLLTALLGYVFAWLQLKSSRAYDLRQAIYVESAAAMGTALEFFSKVPQLSVEDSELAGFIQLTSVATYKSHVVATPSTMVALTSANQSLTMSALDLMALRAQLRVAVDGARVDEHGAGQDVARLQRTLFLESMRASLRYQHEIVNVNIAARRELGLPLDEAQYRKVSQESEAKIIAAIDRATRELGQPSQPGRPLEPAAR
jgi:hypothetical protein